MNIRRLATSAAIVVTMTGAVAALAPGAASGGTDGIKWYHSRNFATQAECVAEKNFYRDEYGLQVEPIGAYCDGPIPYYFFEYAQEF